MDDEMWSRLTITEKIRVFEQLREFDVLDFLEMGILTAQNIGATLLDSE